MLHIRCDTHTHTIYSRHAYSTVEENVRAAAELGIGLLGSTDHYSSMLFPEVEDTRRAHVHDLRDHQYFINYHCWPREWCGVRLLHGCEADIVDLEGHLFGWDVAVEREINGTLLPESTTLKERVFKDCDYVIASVHNDDFTKGATLAKTTEMYLRALEDPKVLILGHLGRSGVPFDVDAVLMSTREHGKMVEINEATLVNHTEAAASCRAIASRAAELGCMVSTGSDAHISYDVGRLGRVRGLLEDLHFPQELIATTDADSFLEALRCAVVP